ncbi:SDR family NAD(P)-dependent oxidoreductase [candidate division CSSED10-310 bacterium]|uniref:SDR family NAD(P)-dependent oxidoreductase n=1 Tax=candidate division CSSED10-310 bacterium TaxID=2855610 RepID=A0ABV6Z2K7_UNCC1
MTKVKDAQVLITGAARGIGFCTAEEFARAGSILIISDINEEAVHAAAEKLRQLGATVFEYVVDISQQEQVEAMIVDIKQKLGGVDILINNAGIGHNGEMVETNLKTWKKLMDVNFWGALYHIYALLPDMVRNRKGHIVNVSSGQAFFRLPTWGVYATIKLALGGFSEMLHFEVKKFGINVTTVYPFMVNTPFYQGIEGDTYFGKLSMKLVPYYSNSPQTVARKIFKAVERDERVEMINLINNVGIFTSAFPYVGAVVSTLTSYFLGKGTAEIEVVPQN